MPRHASNADRIARAAAEAAATASEKQEKKKKAAAEKPARPRRGAAAAVPVRLKVVWAVGRPGLQPVKTYPYPQKDAADADASARGGDFRVVGVKVPME